MPGFDIASIGQNAANTAIGAGMGLILGGYNDRRQLKQNQKLQDQQIAGQKQMTDYNMSKQLQMWKDTSYGAQKEQMQKAGLNPGLMYGMGGGGGQSTGNANGNVSGGSAQQNPGEMQGMGISMLQAQNIAAQTENIKADTKNKQAGTIKTGEESYKLQLENIINDLWTNRDTEGEEIPGPEGDKNRAGFKQKVAEYKKTEAEGKFTIDENKRQEILNNPKVREIQQKIDLMKSQGLQADQMTSNLEKEGQIKQMEIEWSKMGLTRESLTKFIQMLILKIL